MSMQEIHVELLLNRRVTTLEGRCIGRLEEICAETSSTTVSVTEYLVGSAALFERLAAWSIFRAIFGLLGLSQQGAGYRVKWNQLDIGSPHGPILRCAIEDLTLIGDSG